MLFCIQYWKWCTGLGWPMSYSMTAIEVHHQSNLDNSSAEKWISQINLKTFQLLQADLRVAKNWKNHIMYPEWKTTYEKGHNKDCHLKVAVNMSHLLKSNRSLIEGYHFNMKVFAQSDAFDTGKGHKVVCRVLFLVGFIPRVWNDFDYLENHFLLGSTLFFLSVWKFSHLA